MTQVIGPEDLTNGASTLSPAGPRGGAVARPDPESDFAGDSDRRDLYLEHLDVSGPVRRVLMVDDSPIERTLIRAALKTYAAFEVVGEAASAEEGLVLVQQLVPDIVLLDLSMPGMGGLEALPKIQAACPSAVVVVLSGFVSDGIARAALAAGAASCLDKNLPAARWVEKLALLRSIRR